MQFASLLLSILLLTLACSAQLADPLESPPKLNIRRISVMGNSLLTEADIRKITSPFQERDLTLSEMQEVAQALEAEYHRRGYALVNVVLPSQKPSGGLLLLQVVEPSLNQVSVEGNSRYSEEFLKARFRDNIEGNIYRTQDVERSLLLLNDLPDLKVKALLRPGEDSNSTEIVLAAEEDKNYHFTLDYNNFGTRLTGEHRFSLGADFSSVFTNGDQVLVGGMLATPAESTTFFHGSYSIPVGTAGTRLGLGYATGNYSVGQELESLNIVGETEVSTLTLTHPLARSFQHSSDLTFQLSHNDIVNRAFGRPLSNDEYVAARLNYNAQWQDERGRTIFGAGVSKGLGGTRSGDPNASRRDAGADFTKFQLNLARIQQLNESFSLIGRGSGQFTSDPLFAVEQLAVGGPDTVRGYNPAETLGDQGYTLSAELRWSPLTKHRDLFQTVFFLDHGGITQKLPQPGLPGTRHLTGAGFGFRVNHKQTRARLDFGFPLSPERNQLNRSPVVYGQVTTRF